MNEDSFFSFKESPLVEKSPKDSLLQSLHYEDWSPQNPPNAHSFDNQTPKRWDDVCTTIASEISVEDLLSREKSLENAQRLCLAALREKPFWNDSLEGSGKFLNALEITLASAQLHHEYDNTPFIQRVQRVLTSYSSDNSLSPLLRRKIEAVIKKTYSSQDRDRVSGIDLEQKYGFFTTNVQQRNRLVKIAPDRYGSFDVLGRMTKIIDPKKVGSHPVENDPLLSRPDFATDVAFTFDLELRKQLSQDFGFPIETLTLREQIATIATMRQIDTTEEKQILSFVQRFGLDGARAFLSTEFGDGFRRTVSSIAEKFSEDDAKQIFKSFSEIVTFAQETAEALGARFFTNDKTYNADAVRTELLSRAKDLLLTAESSDATSITSKLARFKSDIVLFASMFKVTQKGQEVKFEDIKDVHLESLSSHELQSSDKIVMEKILTENWSKQAPELLKSTLESLRESFANPRSQFFILRKGDGIAASVRFDEQDDGSLYAGSLNVNDVYRSAGIGEAMLQSTIDSLAKTHVITAHVPASLPVAMKYVNDFGLKIVGIDEETAPDGTVIRDLQLERDDEKNRHYGAHPHIERFDLSYGDQAILDVIARQTAHGQVATKYFSDPLNPTLRYIAFEAAVNFSQKRHAA